MTIDQQLEHLGKEVRRIAVKGNIEPRDTRTIADAIGVALAELQALAVRIDQLEAAIPYGPEESLAHVLTNHREQLEALNKAVWHGSINVCLNKHRLAIEALQRGDAQAPKSVHPSHLSTIIENERDAANAHADEKESQTLYRGSLDPAVRIVGLHGEPRPLFPRIGSKITEDNPMPSRMLVNGKPRDVQDLGGGHYSLKLEPEDTNLGRVTIEPAPLIAGIDVPSSLTHHGAPPMGTMIPHAMQRHGDPTTAALEALTAERDRVDKQNRANWDGRKTAEAQVYELRRVNKCITDERDELQRRVDVDTGALRLANTEANRLRERVNPLIASQFSGQDIADAIVNTVQMLEAQLTSAKSASGRQLGDTNNVREELARAIEDRDSLSTKCAELSGRLGELQLKSTGHRSTIVDQARQIAELREALATAHSNHAAALSRQASTWESDRAEGAAQVVRLVKHNEELRVSVANITADRERHMASIAEVTRQRNELRDERDQAWRCLDHRVDGQPFYSEQDRPLEAMVSEVLAHYRSKLAKLHTFARVARNRPMSGDVVLVEAVKELISEIPATE